MFIQRASPIPVVHQDKEETCVDIELIKSFPPHLRWFVQDDDDAEFLLAAATDVFQKPQRASAHQNDVIKACLRKAGSKPLYTL